MDIWANIPEPKKKNRAEKKLKVQENVYLTLVPFLVLPIDYGTEGL